MAEGGEGVKLHALLLQLQHLTGNREFRLLKLAAWCIGLTPRKLEETQSISDLYSALEDVFSSDDAIAILYLCFKEAEVDAKTVKMLPIKLKKTDYWRQKKEMKFALMVIGICNQITGKDCKQFIDLWKDDIRKICHDQLPDIETLFQLLFRYRIVWLDNVERLEEVLVNMGNQLCVDMVENYRRSINCQETTSESDPARVTNPMLEMEKGHSSSPVYPTGSEVVTGNKSIAVTVRSHQLEGDAPVSAANGLISFNDDIGFPQCDSGVGYSFSQSFHSPKYSPNLHGGNTNTGSPLFDKAGNTDSNIDSQSLSSSYDDESTFFIKSDKPTRTVVMDGYSRSKFKTLCCQFVAILIVILVVVLASVAITFVVPYFKQTNGIAENAVKLTLLAHEGDTIYLDTVDGTWYKNISVTEVTQNGDASHVNSIFLTDKDPNTSLVYQSHTLHQASSSYVTGSVRYQYLLDGSSVQYTMCLAYRTSGELYDSMVYVFNNAQHYWDYINEVPGAESYALCSKKLEVGMFNKSMCTPLECNISYPAFHFIAAKTGGDIFYNFSYTIDKVYLNRSDYSEVCNVFEGKYCKLDLPEATLYHVLAYTVHSESIESTITHLSLKTGTPSQTVSSNLTLYMILFIFCGCLALFWFLVLTVMCCFKCSKASLCTASIQ